MLDNDLIDAKSLLYNFKLLPDDILLFNQDGDALINFIIKNKITYFNFYTYFNSINLSQEWERLLYAIATSENISVHNIINNNIGTHSSKESIYVKNLVFDMDHLSRKSYRIIISKALVDEGICGYADDLPDIFKKTSWVDDLLNIAELIEISYIIELRGPDEINHNDYCFYKSSINELFKLSEKCISNYDTTPIDLPMLSLLKIFFNKIYEKPDYKIIVSNLWGKHISFRADFITFLNKLQEFVSSIENQFKLNPLNWDSYTNHILNIYKTIPFHI